jgi:hypothetical protein
MWVTPPYFSSSVTPPLALTGNLEYIDGGYHSMG